MARWMPTISVIMLVVPLMLLFLPVLGPTVAQGPWKLEIEYGDLDGNTTWTASDSPVHVKGTVTVQAGFVLTIQPGVKVYFDSATELDVEGKLKAENVLFTSSSPSPSPGAWWGISFATAEQAPGDIKNVNVTYAFTGITVEGSKVWLQGVTVTKFSMTGLEVTDTGFVNMTHSRIESPDGDGVSCEGVFDAYRSTINGYTAIEALDGCSGQVDASVITANTYYGVDAESGASLVISNSLINATVPESSTGVSASTGSSITLRRDDIVGHQYGIETETGSIKVEGVSVRNCFHYCIDSDAYITIKGSFVGRPKPFIRDLEPADGSEQVSFEAPLSAPFDLVGIPQPPSAAITSHITGETVADTVTLTGLAWDPDVGQSVAKVEVRIQMYDGAEVVQWTTCDGTSSWSYKWSTNGLDTDLYKVVLRVTSSDGEVAPLVFTYLNINEWTNGGGLDLFNSIMTLYLTMCVIGAVTVIVIVIAVAYYFMIHKKKKDEQLVAAQAQAYQQAVAQSYAAPPPQAFPPPTAQTIGPSGVVAPNVIIDDVFLIFKDGRLIHHDTRRLRPEVDDQMLGGMFTAIQEFVGQSFPSEDGTKSTVKEITYEDSKILLEHGNFVYLAVVTKEARDTSAIHKRMSKLIKGIEYKSMELLKNWDGNVSALTEAKGLVKLMYSDDDIDAYI